MTVKNTSSKIIAFGSETLLPGEAKALAESWGNNPIVKMYLERGMLQRVDEAPTAVPETTAEPDSKPTDDAPREPEAKETKSRK